MAEIIKLDKETKTLNVYFSDLTAEAQKTYLEFQRYETKLDSPLDFHTVPILMLTACEV